mmetsp:Transcript_19474/g.73611  ORF Transcript_19474/g.73611 Transcript_19474/m.73611 type:complete len:227 (-) Transcript_19474:2683-3363(-)
MGKQDALIESSLRRKPCSRGSNAMSSSISAATGSELALECDTESSLSLYTAEMLSGVIRSFALIIIPGFSSTRSVGGRKTSRKSPLNSQCPSAARLDPNLRALLVFLIDISYAKAVMLFCRPKIVPSRYVYDSLAASILYEPCTKYRCESHHTKGGTFARSGGGGGMMELCTRPKAICGCTRHSPCVMTRESQSIAMSPYAFVGVLATSKSIASLSAPPYGCAMWN